MTLGFDSESVANKTSSRSQVVVTGLGATTPLGGDVATTWAGLIAGASGVDVLHDEWADQLPVKIAARLAIEPTEILPRVQARRLDRCQQVALVAARQAWQDAGLDSSTVDTERLAAVVATGIGGVLTLLNQYDVLREQGHSKVSPYTVPMLMPNGPTATVALEIGARAGAHAPVSACASGAEAIAWGLDMIRAGRADVVLVGGAEACIHPLPIAGFSQLRALSTRNDDPQNASRPFDKTRDGFVLGEGAGVLVLERREHAEARNATIYGVLAGAGMTADAHHVTAPEPDGTGAGRAISMALEDAGLTPSDIGHVNAHATATPVGDVAEAKAIQKALGDQPIVTSTKSMTGHLLGASGAVEAIATLLAIRNGIIPPTRNLSDLDDDIELQIAANIAQKTQISAAVSNSFGFGGHNVALVFTKS